VTGDHHHPPPIPNVELRAAALESLLVEKGIVSTDAIDAVVAAYESERAQYGVSMIKRRRHIRVPRIVDERLAAFLGYLIGDGHISVIKRVIGLTTGDESQADHFAALTEELFGLTPRKKWDATKWRVLLSSRNLQDFLTYLGLQTGIAARRKTVPDVILRSPASVVAAFLRALYDCDGYAGKAGVILATSSDTSVLWMWPPLWRVTSTFARLGRATSTLRSPLFIAKAVPGSIAPPGGSSMRPASPSLRTKASNSVECHPVAASTSPASCCQAERCGRTASQFS